MPFYLKTYFILESESGLIKVISKRDKDSNIDAHHQHVREIFFLPGS